VKTHLVFAATFLASAIGHATAIDMTFGDALAAAEHDEASLTGQPQFEMNQAKNDVALTAFTSCASDAVDPDFIIVAKLDQAGKTIQTWRQGNSDLAKCFEEHVQAAELTRPPRSTFYVYFSVK
jgi:hypothetical protein